MSFISKVEDNHHLVAATASVSVPANNIWSMYKDKTMKLLLERLKYAGGPLWPSIIKNAIILKHNCLSILASKCQHQTPSFLPNFYVSISRWYLVILHITYSISCYMFGCFWIYSPHRQQISNHSMTCYIGARHKVRMYLLRLRVFTSEFFSTVIAHQLRFVLHTNALSSFALGDPHYLRRRSIFRPLFSLLRILTL